MRPKARDKKLHQEWVVPLKSIEDVQEVVFPFLNTHINCFLRHSPYAQTLANYLVKTVANQKFKELCLGSLNSSPWSELDGLQPETKIINEQLGKINSNGFLTINSQPSVNAAKSDSPAIGNKFIFLFTYHNIVFQSPAYCLLKTHQIYPQMIDPIVYEAYSLSNSGLSI